MVLSVRLPPCPCPVAAYRTLPGGARERYRTHLRGCPRVTGRYPEGGSERYRTQTGAANGHERAVNAWERSRSSDQVRTSAQ